MYTEHTDLIIYFRDSTYIKYSNAYGRINKKLNKYQN